MTKLKVITLFVAICGLTALAAMETEPMLRINTTMHSETINDISIDAAEKLLLSCSADRTARLWDLASGELLHVLRPTIDKNSEGVLLACALSPDGQKAVVGGVTAGNQLIVFDTTSGKIVNLVKQRSMVVTDLQFSPDGRYLAVGHAIEPAVVYRVADWEIVKILDSFGEVTKIAFDNNGYMVVVGVENIIRVYNSKLNLVEEAQFSTGSKPYSIAISPDTTKLAVCFMDSPVPAVLTYPELALLYEPDATGFDMIPNAFTSACFSADGTKLLGSGNIVEVVGETARWMYREWEDAGRGGYRDHPVAGFAIMDMKPLSNGGVVFGSASPDWGRTDASGTLLVYNQAESYDFQNLGLLHVSPDAQEIGQSPLTGVPFRFQFAKRLLTHEESAEPTFIDSIPGVVVTDWLATQEPKLNGVKLTHLHKFENSSAVDIVPENEVILMGGSFSLNCLDYQGNIIWRQVTLATVMEVKAAPEAQIVVVTQLDGTVRWYNLLDGTLLLTLFLHRDGRQWILYTPGGYYDCSPGSENLIGWHMNQSDGKESLFYPVGRFRGTYYRPDVIDLVLSTRDAAEALRLANLEAGITATGKSIDSILPPSVTILSPAHNSAFQGSEVTVAYEINSPQEEPVTSLRVLLDGRPHQVMKGKDLAGNSGSITVNLPGRNLRLGLIAENRFGKSEMAEVKLLWHSEQDKVEVEQKPNLYVLVIGINDYQVQELQLRYSAKDANDFASTIRLQDDLMYENVTLKLLTNDQATRENILDGLDWLQEQCGAEDVAMIFLSGHGANDKIGQFYYLPVGADVSKLKSSCIPFSDFENTLSAIPGKVILFADACHSGGIYTDSQIGMPDLNRFINELTSAEVGVVIFTSSTPRQRSLESPEWENGAFTKALVEGLTGAADFKNKGRISIKALDYYISDRVRELTGNKQTPTTIVPQSISDFDIGLVP